MNIERVETDRDSRPPLCSGVDTVRGIVPVVIVHGGTLLGYSLSKKFAVRDQRSVKSRFKPWEMKHLTENEHLDPKR